MLLPAFSFPAFAQMYPNEKRKLKRFREYLRYRYSVATHYKQCKKFEAFLNQHPLWIPLFQHYPYRVNTLLSTYCDRQWNASQRLQAVMNNLMVIQQKFGVDCCQRLLNEGHMVLATLTEDLILRLNINLVDPLEGLFSINLQDRQTQQSVYDASFTFLSENQLLIASIQGPKGEQAQEQVRHVTKELHGMRPMFMLVYCFRLFAQQFHCALLGIPHRKQAKYRWNDSRRLLFDYDAFWQENEGDLHDGYWHIPTQIERKPLEDIQSKKRSMYRKRYEMFDGLSESIKACFCHGSK
ncbi:VirK/YbjX family protein [Pasteurella sp. PK-2025]|uniref:VirK/YbjX family protein n=2 Tax=Pasteurella TaxID=745 RepID=UPI003C77F673